MPEHTPSVGDQFEIRQALLAYMRGIDTKDYELFRSGFSDDVRVTFEKWVGPLEGLDRLAAFMQTAPWRARWQRPSHYEGAKIERTAGPAMLPPGYDTVTPGEAARRVEAWLDVLPVTEIFFWDSVAGMATSP